MLFCIAGFNYAAVQGRSMIANQVSVSSICQTSCQVPTKSPPSLHRYIEQMKASGETLGFARGLRAAAEDTREAEAAIAMVLFVSHSVGIICMTSQ
jgi:hypothetical protein